MTQRYFVIQTPMVDTSSGYAYNKSIPAIWADSHILGFISLILFGFQVDRILIRLRILLRS
jgi:hypothetical protein